MVIFCIQILWNLFVWLMSYLDYGLSYNSDTHSRDTEDKYYDRVNTFVISCLILSIIIFAVSLSFSCFNRKISKIINIINIILMTIHIIIFIFYCINLFKIFDKDEDTILPIISIIGEILFIVTFIIFDQIKLK